MDQATRAEHRTFRPHSASLRALGTLPSSDLPELHPPSTRTSSWPHRRCRCDDARARAVTMDDKVPSGGCEGISGSRAGILALRFALEHTPSQPRRRTNVTLPSLKRPRRRLIDNERGDAEERRFALGEITKNL